MAAPMSQTVIIIISLVSICTILGVVNIAITSATLAQTNNANNQLADLLPTPTNLEGTCETGIDAPRRQKSYVNRVVTAFEQYNKPIPCHPNNGDEALFPLTHAASYSKGLPHDSLGHVNLAAYNLMLAAVNSGLSSDWDAVPLGE